MIAVESNLLYTYIDVVICIYILGLDLFMMFLLKMIGVELFLNSILKLLPFKAKIWAFNENVPKAVLGIINAVVKILLGNLIV